VAVDDPALWVRPTRSPGKERATCPALVVKPSRRGGVLLARSAVAVTCPGWSGMPIAGQQSRASPYVVRDVPDAVRALLPASP
jgi:hypothetical protein